VFVTEPDPGLEVKRVEPDRVERKTRFLLWTSKEPQVLPFYVRIEGLSETAAWASSHNGQISEGSIPTDSHLERHKTGGDLTDSPALLGGLPRVTAHKGELTQRAMSSPAVLVAPGKPAKLVIETATLRMTALVTPLESGVKGQIIRVRNLDTQRVFEAEVVGGGLLQAELGHE
jgi:flagella basal body P-ring formation protein FlgA